MTGLPRALPLGGLRPPTPAEQYADAYTAAAALRRCTEPPGCCDCIERADHVQYAAMADYMLRGAAFRYADLAPLVKQLIEIQHPDRIPEPDSVWRWPNARTEDRESFGQDA